MADERKWQSNGYYPVGGSESNRVAKRVQKLGVIPGAKPQTNIFRNPQLALFDAYYEGDQNCDKMDWNAAADQACDGDYVPVRKRKPKINANYAKVLCDRVASKLVGEQTFPQFTVADDPDTEEFIRMIIKTSKLKSRIVEPIKRMLAAGSVLVRYYHVQGQIKIEKYLSKYCYPQFNAVGELAAVTIKYVYPDPEEKDEKGKPVLKWFKMDLGPMSDIMYDNPVYNPNEVTEPEFKVVDTAQHNLGFVQAEWFTTAEPDQHNIDGCSLIEPILSIVDDESYSLSQSSQAISYNQDPQLTLKGMDIDTIDGLVRSSTKAWNLGREGEANFLETDLGAVQTAKENREEVKLLMQDLTRVVFLNPDKIDASAMSGKAMEIMHGPLVELINELRPTLEQCLINLILKMMISTLILNDMGEPVPVEIPKGWKPSSLSIEAIWPPVFPMTIEDTKQRLGVVIQATNANLLSRETGTKWIAPDFGIEDLEEELAKIAAQPVINPFGGF